MPTLIRRALNPSHATVIVRSALLHVALRSHRDAATRAIVRHEDKNCVLQDAEAVEVVAHLRDVVVDASHHAVEPSAVGRAVAEVGRGVGVAGGVALLDVEWGVRRIAGNVGHEWLVLVLRRELGGLGEEDVGAVALKALRLAVHLVYVVKIIISPSVLGVADAAAAMRDGELEPALERAERGSVSEVWGARRHIRWATRQVTRTERAVLGRGSLA